MSKGTFVIVLWVAVAALPACQQRVAVFEIPDGYVGWVTVAYASQLCDSETESSSVSTISVREDGTACSSTWNGVEGLTYTRFFYVDSEGDRLRELESTGWGEGGEIWAESSVPAEKKVHFFVGTETDFNETKTGPG